MAIYLNVAPFLSLKVCNAMLDNVKYVLRIMVWNQHPIKSHNVR